MITNDERDNLLKVITDWDYKESKILKFGVVYDIQKDNDKEIDKGQSMYLKINEEVINELKEKDSMFDVNVKFKDRINDIINWYPDIRNKALEASRKIRKLKKSKNKIELYKDVLRYTSIVATIQLHAIAGLIEDDLYIEHNNMKKEDVLKLIAESANVLYAFYIKFRYQFDEEIKPGYDIDKIIIPIYKNPDSYEVLQNTMDEIGLMSIIPSDILDKCIMLAKTGGRDKSLKVIEQNEKTTLIN